MYLRTVVRLQNTIEAVRLCLPFASLSLPPSPASYICIDVVAPTPPPHHQPPSSRSHSGLPEDNAKGAPSACESREVHATGSAICRIPAGVGAEARVGEIGGVWWWVVVVGGVASLMSSKRQFRHRRHPRSCALPASCQLFSPTRPHCYSILRLTHHFLLSGAAVDV